MAKLSIRELQQKAKADPDSLTVQELSQLQKIQAMDGVAGDIVRSRVEEESSNSPVLTCSRTQAIALMGLSLDSVDKLLEKGMLRRAGRGEITIQSICDRLRSRAVGGKMGNLKEKLLTAQGREKRAKAQLSEIQLARERGDLLLATEVKRDYGAAVDIVRAKLMEIPSALAVQLAALGDPETVRHELDMALRVALESMVKKVMDTK